MIYGTRNPGLLIYKDELEAWGKRDDIDLNVAVDNGDVHHHLAGDADEVRYRAVRPLTRGRDVCLQGLASALAGGA
jgi:NAD(P)H-flavin reductase